MSEEDFEAVAVAARQTLGDSEDLVNYIVEQARKNGAEPVLQMLADVQSKVDELLATAKPSNPKHRHPELSPFIHFDWNG